MNVIFECGDGVWILVMSINGLRVWYLIISYNWILWYLNKYYVYVVSMIKKNMNK